MNQRAQLMQAVIDEPDDDAVRLVFADWLQDHGEEARAEFIRVQIALAYWDGEDYETLTTLAQREEMLWREHHAAWCAELPKWSRAKVNFRRGFPASVGCSIPQWLTARSLCRQAPIQGLNLGRYDARKRAEFCATTQRFPLRVISLTACHPHAERAEVLRALSPTPLAQSLRVLGLAQGVHLPNGTAADCVAETLATANFRPECLDLSRTELAPAVVGALLWSPCVANLRTLSLSFGNGSVRVLENSASLGKLTELDLGTCLLTDVGLEALVNMASLHRLTHLTIYSWQVTAAGIQALAQSPHLRNLRELTVRMGGPGRVGAQALAQSSSLVHLRKLRLMIEGDAAGVLRELAAAPALQELRAIELLGDISTTAANVRELAHSPALPALESLSLLGGSTLGKLAAELGPALDRPHRNRLRLNYQPTVHFSGAAREYMRHFYGVLHGPVLLWDR